MPVKPTFASRLRELREAAGLSVQALADAAGLKRQGIYLLESGQRSPSWETVCALAKALKVAPTAFPPWSRS